MARRRIRARRHGLVRRVLLSVSEEAVLTNRVWASAGGSPDAPLSPDAAEALHRLVEANLGLVHAQVRRYGLREGPVYEDLFQEGVLGMMAAARRFDPASGVRFSTFAVTGIRFALSSAYRRCRHLILARDDRDGATALDSLIDPVGVEIDFDGEAAVRPDPVLSLRESLAHLDPIARQAVEMRFGLSGDQVMTHAAIGRHLCVSRSRAHQLVNQAVHQLRRAARQTEGVA